MKNIKYGLVAALTMASFVPVGVFTNPVSATVAEYCSSSYVSSATFTKGSAMEAADTAWTTAEGYADTIANASFGQDISSTRTALYGYENSGYTLSRTGAYAVAATAEAEAITELEDIIDSANYKDLTEMKSDIETYITGKTTTLGDAISNLESEISGLESFAQGFGASHATEIAAIVEALTATKTTLSTQLATYQAYDLDAEISDKEVACATIESFTIDGEEDPSTAYLNNANSLKLDLALDATLSSADATVEYSVSGATSSIAATVEGGGGTLAIDASSLAEHSHAGTTLTVTATVAESGDSASIELDVSAVHYGGEVALPTLTDEDGNTSVTIDEGSTDDLTILTGINAMDDALSVYDLFIIKNGEDVTMDDLYENFEYDSENGTYSYGDYDAYLLGDDDFEWDVEGWERVSSSAVHASATGDVSLTISGDYLSKLEAGEYTVALQVYDYLAEDEGLAKLALTVKGGSVSSPNTGANAVKREGAVASTTGVVAGLTAMTAAGAAVVACKQRG